MQELLQPVLQLLLLLAGAGATAVVAGKQQLWCHSTDKQLMRIQKVASLHEMLELTYSSTTVCDSTCRSASCLLLLVVVAGDCVTRMVAGLQHLRCYGTDGKLQCCLRLQSKVVLCMLSFVYSKSRYCGLLWTKVLSAAFGPGKQVL